MNHLRLLSLFSKESSLLNKSASTFGDDAYSVEEMTDAIQQGFDPNNLVLGAQHPNKNGDWLYAHIESAGEGSYLVSSDMPHTGIPDVAAKCEIAAIEAVNHILKQLFSQ